MAAGSIGTLKALLVLDTAPWNAGFNAAASTVKGFGSGVLGSVGGMVRGFGGQLIAAAAGVATVSVSVRGLADSFSHVASLSGKAKNLGIPVESLQKLSIVAEQSGVELDQLTKFMFLMGKNVGSGGQPLDKRLLQVADAIAAMPDPAERAGAAFKVFGKGGYELIGLLSKGSEGIRRSADAVDRFGLAIKDVDAAKVKEAKLALMEVSAVMHGMRDKLAVELAPAVRSFATIWLAGLEGIIRGFDELNDRVVRYSKIAMILANPGGGLVANLALQTKFSQDLMGTLGQMGKDEERDRRNKRHNDLFGAGALGGLGGGGGGGGASRLLGASGSAVQGSVEAARMIAIATGGSQHGKVQEDILTQLKQINGKTPQPRAASKAAPQLKAAKL